MREDHDRGGGAEAGEVGLEPCKLLGAKVAHRIDLHAVVQADEVNALVVVAVPAVADCSLAEALLVQRAVVREIMLAGNVEHLLTFALLMICEAVSNSPAFEFCVMSPV